MKDQYVFQDNKVVEFFLKDQLKKKDGKNEVTLQIQVSVIQNKEDYTQNVAIVTVDANSDKDLFEFKAKVANRFKLDVDGDDFEENFEKQCISDLIERSLVLLNNGLHAMNYTNFQLPTTQIEDLL